MFSFQNINIKTPEETNLNVANLDDFEEDPSIGQIISVKDGVAFVTGLDNIQVGEMVEFIGKGLNGMALNLESEQVGCIIFGDDTDIQQDDSVKL